MRELIEDLYLFSLSSDSFGNIIAQRTRGEFSLGEKNVFEHLGIDHSELHFLNNAYGGNAPIVLASTRNSEKRAVMFDISSSREIGVGVAMEFFRPAREIAQAYVGKEELVSPRAREILNDFEKIPYDVTSEMSASRSFAGLCSLRGIYDGGEADTSALFRDIFSSVAELVCVPIECAFDIDAACFGNGLSLLHTNACLFITLAMAMAAREYSPQRRLFAVVSERDSFVSVSLGFECGETRWQGESLFKSLISDCDLICELCERDGKVICALAPSYADEGLIGVKENMSILQMLEFWQ